MKRSSSFTAFGCVAVVVASCLASRVALCRSGDDKKDSPAAEQFEALKRLSGTWESDKSEDGKPQSVVFRTTSGGSMVMETMFPGSKHEMVNTYHLDGDKLMATHYCAMGNQPRMRSSGGDSNDLKFDFVDCTNQKEGQGCMGGLELIIDGDKLTEKWSFRTDGKMGEAETFEFHRKA
jgi:hypothetical protein